MGMFRELQRGETNSDHIRDEMQLLLQYLTLHTYPLFRGSQDVLTQCITDGHLGCFPVEGITSGAAFLFHVDDGHTCGFLSVRLLNHRVCTSFRYRQTKLTDLYPCKSSSCSSSSPTLDVVYLCHFSKFWGLYHSVGLHSPDDGSMQEAINRLTGCLDSVFFF